MNIEKAIEQFKNYTNDYINLSSKCVLKVDHTLRVMDLCEQIALSLDLSEEEIALAKVCGLLHDIGRFEQWKQYETFNDLKSIDHGDMGYKILIDNNCEELRKFIEQDEYNSVILNSVRYHNKYQVPEFLTEQEKLFTNIVRDADKLDILYLYTRGDISINPGMDKMTDNIYQSLINKEGIKKVDIKTNADRVAVSLGFAFDFNYKKSFEILKENNYLTKEISIYKNSSENEEFINQLTEIESVINEYINKKTIDEGNDIDVRKKI